MAGMCGGRWGTGTDKQRPGNKGPYGSLWRSLDFILRIMGGQATVLRKGVKE